MGWSGFADPVTFDFFWDEHVRKELSKVVASEKPSSERIRGDGMAGKQIDGWLVAETGGEKYLVCALITGGDQGGDGNSPERNWRSKLMDISEGPYCSAKPPQKLIDMVPVRNENEEESWRAKWGAYPAGHSS